MIYDCLYLLNELDLLEIRLNILSPYVDCFVILEATKTFSGQDKALCFDKERFKPWMDKIIYYVVDDWNDEELWALAKSSPNVGAGEDFWVREFYIKESLKKALVQLQDDDVCFISDLDEIWKHSGTLKIEDYIYKFRQLPYLYYLNNRTDEDWLGWSGTIMAKYKNIKNEVINHLRTDGMTKFVILENGGWHFNAIGGAKKKIEASKHPIINQDLFTSKEINMRKDESDLPEYIMDNKEKWKQYFL